MSKVIYFVVLFFLPLKITGGTFIYDVPVSDVVFDISQVERFDRIVVPGSFSVAESGQPDIPGVTFHYLLPYDQKLTKASIVDEQWQSIPGTFKLYPKQPEHIIGESVPFVRPDPSVYSSGTLYPVSSLVNTGSGNLRGFQIAHLVVMPFRYVPNKGEVQKLTKLTLKLETQAHQGYIYPHRQTQLARTVTERMLHAMGFDKSVMKNCPPYILEENPRDLASTDLPSLLGAPVDYLIITTEELYDVYQDFARFKKQYGYNTAVKTLTWVNEHYSGIDNAERVRNFIRDAVENWGVVYVLIGADTDEVPARWVWMPSQYWQQGRFPVLTDHYYSDLDGNWNFDGDARFCEVADSLDLYADVYVGRLPTVDSQQVSDYLNKLNAYLQPSVSVIQAKALFFTSDLNEPDDSYDSAKRIAEHLPSHFDTVFLNKKTKDELEDSLNAGFGVVTGIGHGDVNNIKPKPGQWVDNWWFDSLENTNRYPIMFWISCLNQTLQSNCLGKHWIWNPAGCGIGSIGPSYYSDATVHEQYTKKQFDWLFKMPLAQSLAKGKSFYVGISASENWYRIYQFSLNLYGDAALMPWDSVPQQFNSVTITPETVFVGVDTVMITVDPAVPFQVVLYKEGELFKWDSTAADELTSAVKTESSGYVKYTVMRDGYIAYVDSVVVERGGEYLVYDGQVVIDTLAGGNGDGVVNPGEEVALRVLLRNNGGAVATGVDIQVLCSDSLLTMVYDTASYPDVAVDSVVGNVTLFRFVVSDSVPDGYSFDCGLSMSYSGEVSEDSFQVIAGAQVLVHYAQEWVRVGDTFTVVPSVVNYGHLSGDSVFGRISVYPEDSTVVTVDTVVGFPVIPVDSAVTSAPDSFVLYTDQSDVQVRYNYRVYCRGLEVINQEVLLQTPAVIDSVWTLGMPSSIVLEWSQVTGAAGYRVYRALDRSGPYTFLHNHLEPMCHFEDIDVTVGSEYYYYLEVVDSSMNHGGVSDTVSARTNPPLAQGWPQPVYAFIKASPAFGDIDTSYPGLEVVVGDNKGNIWAWHYDGTPVVGDGRIFHFGYQFAYPEEFWSTAAIGDVNDDGLLEIVFGVRRDTSNLYIIDGQGNVLTGWPQTVPGRIIGATTLGDLDKDGDLEIVVLSEINGDIYAFHHDGTGVYSPSGLLQDLPGKCYSTPAIGDINCDGDLEIVCTGGGQSDSLYVWDRYGNLLAPYFPVHIPDSNLQYDVVLADIIGDERLEILFHQYRQHKIHVIDATGSTVWTRDLRYVAGLGSFPITADINGDGRPEILCNDQEGFFVFDSLGNDVSPFPDTTHDSGLSIVVNVDDDPDMEIIALWPDCWRLRCINFDNQPAPGFPIQYGHGFMGSPAVYDIDGDGKLELMVSTYDELFYVYDLETTAWDYPKFRYDPYNTGTYDRFVPSEPYLSANKAANGSDAVLTWNMVVTDELGNREMMHHYVVYRSTSPDFTPSPTDSIGAIAQPDTAFTDVGALSAGVSYYYCVTAVDWARNKSMSSNRAYVLHRDVVENQ